METFAQWMDTVNGIVWGPVMIVLLVGTGVYLTFRLRFVQLRYLDHALTCVSDRYHKPDSEGDITPFQALTAALSATVGTGNIAGVATAIALGGPGAVFWMWMTALAGMATKYAGCMLAVRYRVVHADGSVSGGPMYYLTNGLGLRWLGGAFALFAGLASFGIGCAVQSNSVADGLLSLIPEAMQGPRIAAGIPIVGGTLLIKPVIGVVMAVLVGFVILGGIRRIAQVASKIVPVMCALYIAGALIVLIRFASGVPEAVAQIFEFAFTPMAATGGFAGVLLRRTIQKGVARGVFSNESGLGSAPIAHAAARTDEVARQGFVAMLGPFIDTLIVCTMTALVIIVTGAWQVHGADGRVLYGPKGEGIPMRVEIDGQGVQVVGNIEQRPKPFLDEHGEYYKVPTGADLTANAFEIGLGWIGKWIVGIGIALFAYSTMISWSYYGDRCWEYLLGPWAVLPYRCLFCVFVVVGTVSGLDLVWTVADNLNALMAIPNLIGVLGLAGLVVRETRDYLKRMDAAGEL